MKLHHVTPDLTVYFRRPYQDILEALVHLRLEVEPATKFLNTPEAWSYQHPEAPHRVVAERKERRMR